MKIFLYRKLPENFDQDIYIWDVDKTYLHTNFESFKGLMNILFEFAIDKTAIPGAKELLRELRRGKESKIGLSPIFFISASPVMLKKVLEGKFLIDGVQHDGIVLKDYRSLRRLLGKVRIKNNFPYKLMCLLTHRLLIPEKSTEILFGDDFERDADIYSLYADILSHKIDREGVKKYLLKEKLIKKEIEKILALVEKNQKRSSKEVVKKIFIHQIKHQDPKWFLKYGDRLVATQDYRQTAEILYTMGKISKSGLKRISDSVWK